ncbi:MAG: DUF1013 domain-containing protein [Proteobacteria bacterium]|nr:DUF1013 domain-containing protein [Pseudomonadota bacterium]
MAHPLMPKATAVWLVDNTALTFDQIAALCELHPLEVQGIADGEVAIGIVGRDPVTNSELTHEEINRCEKDAAERLVMSEPEIPLQPQRKGPRYTPVSKRQNRPDAISWLVKYHPELSDSQVCKLVGTTKPTVNAVRDRSHWNTPNLKPEDPVTLGMCSQTELDQAIVAAVERISRKEERDRKTAAKAKREKEAVAAAEAAARGEPDPGGADASTAAADPAGAEASNGAEAAAGTPPEETESAAPEPPAEPSPPLATILKPRVEEKPSAAAPTVEGVFGATPASDDDASASGKPAVTHDPFKPK